MIYFWQLRLQNEHVSWKEDPQLPQVRLLKLQSFLSESPHAGSQWGEAFCLQKVQLLLHTSWWPQDTHAKPFRRKALQLHTVQTLLHNSLWPKETHAYPFRRKTYQLHTAVSSRNIRWEQFNGKTISTLFLQTIVNISWFFRFSSNVGVCWWYLVIT